MGTSALHDRGTGPQRRIDLRVRRQAGVEPRYTVRFTVLDGRGLVMFDSDVLVRESDLRTNGIFSDLEVDQVLTGQFVFVSSSGTENAKYRTWDRDRAALEALPPGSVWTQVELTPVSEDPFFILDTDNMEAPFPWRDLVPPVEGEAEDPASESLPEIEPSLIEPVPTGSGVTPAELPPTGPPEAATPSPPAPREAPPPRDDPAARTREQNAYQVVYYLRDQLVQERMRRGLLEDEIRRLQEEIRLLHASRDTS